MISVAGPEGSATYGYGTDNLRVRVSDSQGDRRILLDGMEELAEHPVAGGAAIARFDHDPTRVDALLAQATSAGKANAVADALGSVYAMTNTAGSATARYSFDAYGARTASTETTP